MNNEKQKNLWKQKSNKDERKSPTMNKIIEQQQ